MKKKQVMAILNCTPDSFYDGDPEFSEEKSIIKGQRLAASGADIIDIGGESTRPSSLPVSEHEELRRTIGTVKALRATTKATLSIDTSKPEVAKQALLNGATFINDVTGFSNPKMQTLAKEFRPKICVMHMQKSPKTMQQNPHYPRGVVTEIYEWFEKRLDELLTQGIHADQIYLDIGIGFGKSVEDNLDLIRHLPLFKKLGFGLLIGISRKSFLQKILKKSAYEVLSTTLALNTISLMMGVEIIRVHDIEEHRDIVDLINILQMG